MTIAPALAPLIAPITDFRPHPDNPRRSDLDAIVAGLRRFGQMKPIVVQRSTGFIIARSRVWEAARRLGWTEVAAVVADVDDLTAKRFLIADNRTSDLGDYEDAEVLALIESVSSLDGTGYTQADVDDLVARVTGEHPAGGGEATEQPSVVLTMSEGSFVAFTERVRRLRERWGLPDDASTVLRAVLAEDSALAKTGAPES